MKTYLIYLQDKEECIYPLYCFKSQFKAQKDCEEYNSDPSKVMKAYYKELDVF